MQQKSEKLELSVETSSGSVQSEKIKSLFTNSKPLEPVISTLFSNLSTLIKSLLLTSLQPQSSSFALLTIDCLVSTANTG